MVIRELSTQLMMQVAAHSAPATEGKAEPQGRDKLGDLMIIWSREDQWSGQPLLIMMISLCHIKPTVEGCFAFLVKQNLRVPTVTQIQSFTQITHFTTISRFTEGALAILLLAPTHEDQLRVGGNCLTPKIHPNQLLFLTTQHPR